MSDAKPIQWSHSALKDYEGCPRRYHEVRVLRAYPRQDTAATLYGTEVHSAIEQYVLGAAVLPPKHAAFKGVVDAMLRKPGRRMPELQMAATKELQPCDWFAKDAWVRGVSDLTVLDDDNFTAWVVDWKTGGNKYPDLDQLVLMSLLTFVHFPHIRKVNSALLFIVKGTMNKLQMSRDAAERFWWKYRERVARIEDSAAANVWHARPSPLCGWCPVTKCENHPRH